jgi:P pilus assembly chaperone PapD
MTARILRVAAIQAAISLVFFTALSACRSYHVEITVENRTDAPVKLLEVDYPSASFGTDMVAPGASYHYRIQVQGSGPVTVQYTASDGAQKKISGPTLSQHDQGTLQIVLLPDGKAQFTPHVIQPQ